MTVVGERATLLGVAGSVTRTAPTKDPMGLRNVWWRARDTEEQRMFSLRHDGVWREFPGRADGPGLIFTD